MFNHMRQLKAGRGAGFLPTAGMLAIVFITTCIAAIGAAEPGPPAAQGNQAAASQAESKPVTITVFSTGDVHEHTANLARIAGYVKAAKKKDPNCLLLDAGDMTGGYGEKALAITRGDAVWALLTAAGYDGCILGNWDYGLGKARVLELCRKYPKFPLLMANVQWSDQEKEIAKLIPPYKVFQLEGVKVAVIGTGAHDMRYARKERFAVGFQPPAIQQLVPVLRKQADIVIAVTHQYEGEDYATASGPNAPDLIVGGHSHGAYAHTYGKQKKCFIIKAKAYCRLLGVVKIKWDGRRIVECTGELLDVRKSDWPEDPQVKPLRQKFFDAEEPKEPGKQQACAAGATGANR